MKKVFNRLIRTFDAAKERIINLNRSVEITLTEILSILSTRAFNRLVIFILTSSLIVPIFGSSLNLVFYALSLDSGIVLLLLFSVSYNF